jgi:hypothetical protein
VNSALPVGARAQKNAAVKNVNLNEAQIPCENRIDMKPPPKMWRKRAEVALHRQ